MNLKSIILTSIMVLVAAAPLSPHSSQIDTTKPADWLILDGTRNYGYAMARYLLSQGQSCTLVVKPEDMMLVDLRFSVEQHPRVVTLDFTQPTKEVRNQLLKIARGHRFLLLDPEHGDFTSWHSTITNIATNALITARVCNLTVFYPGRVYPFSNTPTITEKSSYQPETEQGKTLAKVEKMMRHMAQNKFCKTVVIRASYPFGPGMYDFLLSSSFKDIPRNGQLTWLYRTDHQFQFTYTHDVARLMAQLSTTPLAEYFTCLNYAGYTMPSVSKLGDSIVAAAKKHLTNTGHIKLRQRVVTEFYLNIAAKAEPNALRGKDLAAFFSRPVMLDDSKLRTDFSFTPTPLEMALTDTLKWYATNTDTKGLYII